MSTTPRGKRSKVGLIALLTVVGAIVITGWTQLIRVPTLTITPTTSSGMTVHTSEPIHQQFLLDVRGGSDVSVESVSVDDVPNGVHLTLVAVRQGPGQGEPGVFVGDDQITAYTHVPINGLPVVRLDHPNPDALKASWIVARVVFDRPGKYVLPPITVRYRSKWRSLSITAQNPYPIQVAAAGSA